MNWPTGRSGPDAIIRMGNKCIAFTDAGGYAIGQKLLGDIMVKIQERGVVKSYKNH